jgi:tRNA threonylcarbamoyladenosine biosynthesis protein TsaE
MKKDDYVSKNPDETKKIAKELARELKSGGVLALVGDLGSGKTTFTQAILEELGAKGPYTSPTFLVMKHYKKEIPNSKSQITNKSQYPKSKIKNIYHIDAYRIGAKDMINLGWEEITSDKNNLIIVEWADRIKEIIPQDAVWINFSWVDENKRKINFK